MIYEILLTAVWFPFCGSGRYTCTKIRNKSYIPGEKQYTKQYNTELTK